MKDTADAAIIDSNAPSIFEADDFTKPKLTVSTASSTSTSNPSFGGTSNSSSPATGKSVSAAFDAGSVTKTEFNSHLSDSFAHQALFTSINNIIAVQSAEVASAIAFINSISGTLSGTIQEISDISGTYLAADNLTPGDHISIVSGTDGVGRPTRQISLDIQKGIVNGSINGIVSSLLSTGINYEAGRVVTASLANVSTSPNVALCLDTVCTAGSPIGIYVKSGYSGTTVNASFDVHWMMI
jgi:hypothetical protein